MFKVSVVIFTESSLSQLNTLSFNKSPSCRIVTSSSTYVCNHDLGTSPRYAFSLSVCTINTFAFADFCIAYVTGPITLVTIKGPENCLCHLTHFPIFLRGLYIHTQSPM